MIKTTSASYSVLTRLELSNKPGMLGRVPPPSVGPGNMGAVDIVGFKGAASS